VSDKAAFENLQTLGAHIAPHLPGSWRLDTRPVERDDYYRGSRIVGPDHLAIRLQAGGWRQKPGMISIYGEMPNFGLSHQECYAAGTRWVSLSINVSSSRTPQSIAGDIARRLIPDYLQAVAKNQEAAKAFKIKMETLANIEHVFSKVAPTFRRYGGQQHDTRREYCFSAGGEYRSHKLTFSSYSGLSCDLELNDLSPELTIQIMALLDSGKS
jgi:hypothetical protein